MKGSVVERSGIPSRFLRDIKMTIIPTPLYNYCWPLLNATNDRGCPMPPHYYRLPSNTTKMSYVGLEPVQDK